MTHKKTNEEIVKEIRETANIMDDPYGISDEVIMEALQAKDAQHKEEMIELVERVPENIGCWDNGFGCGEGGNEEVIEWKNEQLNQLKG